MLRFIREKLVNHKDRKPQPSTSAESKESAATKPLPEVVDISFNPSRTQKRRIRPPRTEPCEPRYAALDRAHLSLAAPLPQMQSPLFSVLSTELRLGIYGYVLGHLDSPLHIVRYDDGSGRVGYQRCFEPDSLYPTWQHRCFGRWFDDHGRHHQLNGWKRGRLLALPMACRAMYTESIDLLYSSNVFSLKSALGVAALRNAITTEHWHRIRHLRLSTMFLTPVVGMWRSHRPFPPDSYEDWERWCSVIQDLHNLRYFYLELVVWHQTEHENSDYVDVDSLQAIFQPLQNICPPVFEIETNMEIPSSILPPSRSSNYNIIVKERPFNLRVFPI